MSDYFWPGFVFGCLLMALLWAGANQLLLSALRKERQARRERDEVWSRWIIQAEAGLAEAMEELYALRVKQRKEGGETPGNYAPAKDDDEDPAPWERDGDWWKDKQP